MLARLWEVEVRGRREGVMPIFLITAVNILLQVKWISNTNTLHYWPALLSSDLIWSQWPGLLKSQSVREIRR